MPVYLALFRGINVSGHNLIKMEPLKKVLEAEGYRNVQTYIQSGNVIFESDEVNLQAIARAMENLMYKEYGHNVVIFILDEAMVIKAIENNPYCGREPESQGIKKYFVAFLSDVPKSDGLDKLKKYHRGEDEYKIIDTVMYLKLAGSAADSKLTNVFIENKLNVKATTRNWNTTLKVLEMMQESKL